MTALVIATALGFALIALLIGLAIHRVVCRNDRRPADTSSGTAASAGSSSGEACSDSGTGACDGGGD